MNKIFAATSIFGLTLLTATPVYAGSGVSGNGSNPCQPSYGGNENCTVQAITIDKTVANPQNGTFVNNLTVSDPRFKPNQTVTFHITVTNTTNAAIDKVNVKDVLPSYVTFVSGPGNFDTNSKTLSYTISNLGSQKSQTATVVTKVVDTNSLPSDSGIQCVTNESFASTSTTSVEDNAGFCIEKPVLGTQTKGGLTIYPAPNITNTPATGAEAFSLLGLIPAALSGAALRKKTSK